MNKKNLRNYKNKINSVDAYISGHDHNMQHWLHNRVHYFISGLGEFPNLEMTHMNNPMNPIEGSNFLTNFHSSYFLFFF